MINQTRSLADVDARSVVVSAHCRHCKQDIETDGRNRCPDCGAETLPESRGVPRIVAATSEPTALAKATSAPPSPPVATNGHSVAGTSAAPTSAPTKTVKLRPGRKAIAWVAKGQEMLDELEAEEREAVAAFEAARARVLAIRTEAAALRQVLGFVAIGDAPTSSSPASGERRRSPAPLAGRWSRAHEACISCGTTERKHKSHGYCTRCEWKIGRKAANES